MTTTNRMVVAVAALLGLFVSAYLFLYKLGAFGTILCGTGGCITVQNSPFAYFLGLPVALWGLVGYSATLAIAMAGVQPRFVDDRRIPLALLALTGGAFLFSIYLSYLEEFVIGAWCQWCIISAVLSTVAFVAALPELRRARQ